jgi:hypothetical protein
VIAVTLAAVGGVAALWAAVLALRWSSVPSVAGRALCVIAAAPVVALSGVASAAADAAVAAGVCSMMLVASLTPAWERVARGRNGTALAVLALSIAGSLPLGFGITALILELAATVSIGRPGAALLVALGLGGVLGASAAVRTASRLAVSRRVLAAGERLSLLAVVAALASLAGALVPGAAATTVLAALSPGGLTEPVGAAAIRSAAGDWAGGYLVVAFVVIAAGVWAFTTLWGRALPARPAAAVDAEPVGVQALGLRPARRVRPLLLRAGASLTKLDEWLVVQPQLALALGGAIAAIVATAFLVH